MSKSTKRILIILMIVLLMGSAGLQKVIDPQRDQFQPGRKGIGSMMVKGVDNNPVMLPAQFMAGALVGFREVVAGLLWVRCDQFFHSGNYEAIIPLIRIITWLDPHQVDVYCTGGWHLAYNFVDSAQRADRRYLWPAITLEKEGVENNPEIYDIEQCLGFDLYRMKVHDFMQAAYWLKRAETKKDAPYLTSRLIAHSYEKAGQLDLAEEQWRKTILKVKPIVEEHPEDDKALIHYQVSRNNLDRLRIRRELRKDLALNPRDVKFEAEFKRIGPRAFEIKGKIDLPDSARVNLTLWDTDYKEQEMESFHWDVDPDITALVEIGMHGIYVEDGKFQRKYDLTKDAKQYPFTKDKYLLTLTFNPHQAAIEVQDVTGWNGEGITDKNYLDTSIPGLRRIQKVIELDKEDIL